MTHPERELRDRVAAQLSRLAATSGPLDATGARATIQQTDYFGHGGSPTRLRRAFHNEVVARYLARQPDILQEGRAALITAGPPGAGKSAAIDAAPGFAGWRRLDADAVKTYLVEEAAASGRYDDLLAMSLADGHPLLPAELASLVHIESVALLEERLVPECLDAGENVVIEGTLTWAGQGERLMDELIASGYVDVTILDVEVPAAVAHEGALTRWWTGRQETISTGRGLGGRFIPAGAIDRAFPDPTDPHSVCAANARALYDTHAGRDVAIMTLTVQDHTGPSPVVNTEQRTAANLGESLPARGDIPPGAAQRASQSFPPGRRITRPRPAPPSRPQSGQAGHRPQPPNLSR